MFTTRLSRRKDAAKPGRKNLSRRTIPQMGTGRLDQPARWGKYKSRFYREGYGNQHHHELQKLQRFLHTRLSFDV